MSQAREESRLTSESYRALPFGAFWEHGYQDAAVSTMGGPNHDIVELVPLLPRQARVLDLGCGEGRNAFYLAGLGCAVTAVDRSAAGIGKLRDLAEETEVPIEGVVADLSDYDVEGRWDLVMAHGVIDYLDNATWRRLLTQIKDATRPGGINAYTCMLFTAEHPAGPEFEVAGFKHSVGQGELRAFYDDWELLRHDRYVKWDQHPGVPLHCHPVDKVVARRPGAGPAVAREPVPVSDTVLPASVFDGIELGLPADELFERCGEPEVVDTVTMDGLQLGVGPDAVVDGYLLSLWYYGRSVMYVVNGRVWGRARLDSPPLRVRRAPS